MSASPYPRSSSPATRFGKSPTSFRPTGKVFPTPSKSEPSPTWSMPARFDHAVDVVEYGVDGREGVGVAGRVGFHELAPRVSGDLPARETGEHRRVAARGPFACLPGHEAAAEVDLHDTASLGDGFDHVVVHVAVESRDEVAQRGVRGDHGRFGQFEDLPGRLVGKVRDVLHHAAPVDFRHRLLPQFRKAAPSLVQVVAGVGVAVRLRVRERDVADAACGEVVERLRRSLRAGWRFPCRGPTPRCPSSVALQRRRCRWRRRTSRGAARRRLRPGRGVHRRFAGTRRHPPRVPV